MSIRTEAVETTTEKYVDLFTTALMADHSDDYDMETVRNAAWSCARAIVDEVIEREADIVQLHATLSIVVSSLDGPEMVRQAAENQARVMLDTITPPR